MSYASLQRSTVALPPGCGGSALPVRKLSREKKMQDHMEVRPWRPHGMFFISQERWNISRDENLHVL